jgi:hypothetical protein
MQGKGSAAEFPYHEMKVLNEMLENVLKNGLYASYRCECRDFTGAKS